MRLPHRQAEAGPQLRGTFGSLGSVQLQGIEPRRHDRFADCRVIGIDEQPDAADPAFGPRGKLGRIAERKVARARREEIEPGMVRPRPDRRVERVGRGQSADLDRGSGHGGGLGKHGPCVKPCRRETLPLVLRAPARRPP